MDPPGLAIDPGREGVDIGALQLLQLAIVEDKLGKLVAHGGQLLQHIGVGRRPGLGLLEDRQLVLFEQDGGELAGRVEVERRAGHLARSPVPAGPDPRTAPRSAGAKTARSMAIPSHSMSVSTCDQRHLDVSNSASSRFRRASARRNGAAPAPSHCRRRSSRRRPGTPLRRRGSRSCPCPPVGVGLHAAAEVLERKGVDGVGAPARIEHEARQHRVVAHAGQLDPGAPQDLPVVLDVMARLENRRVGEQRRRRGAMAGSVSGGKFLHRRGRSEIPAARPMPKGRYQTSAGSQRATGR